MIKFVVGIFGNEMILHTVLVAEQSSALDSMVNGPMKEAQDKVVIWKDVDEQTFALFAEFVYTGEYTLPDGIEDQVHRSSGLESLLPIESTTDEFKHGFIKKGRRKILNAVSVVQVVLPEQRKRTKFRDLVYRSPAIAPPLVAIPASKMPGKYPNANFLIHARLYVLADRYDIRKLKSLALQNLHTNLSEYCPYGEVYYSDIMVLVRYTYENTPSREQHRDQLRQLVTCYIADEGSKAIARSKQCLDLIEELGAFARDLLSELLADGN